MTTRISKGSVPNLMSEWAKGGMLVWLEVRDQKGLEVYEFLPAIIKNLLPNKTHARIILASDNSEKDVPIVQLHQRNLESTMVNDLTEIPILNDAEILTHLHHLYKNDQIYCYCGPSLIAINPYKTIKDTVLPETMELIKKKLQKRALDQAPPHVWTVAAAAYKNMDVLQSNQAICINGESGAGKTESTKKCLEFLTQLETDSSSAETNDLSDKILACNPILEAFGNSKTLRNDNSSRFGKYVKIWYDPKVNFKIMGATMDNYLLEKSRVVSISKDERGFHIFYAVCRFMPLAKQKQYLLSQNGQPCDLSKFKILRGSGLYETPKINDQEFYNDVVEAFQILEFTSEEQDAIWRIISTILHMGNFEVDSSKYEEGKIPCQIFENEDFMAVIRLLDCDPQSLQDALTLRVREMQKTTIRTPHRPENVVDFFLAMAKDLYNSLFNWIVKKINVILARSLNSVQKVNKLKTIGLLDIFGFEIFDKNYIEQLFINYANERLQGLYIDHIFKNECTIFKNEGLDNYISLITYKDNLALIKVLDSNVTPPGVFSLTNQICRLNQKDEQLMNELRKVHAKPTTPEVYIGFHKIKQNLFYVKHTAREVEYTIDGFVEKSRDEISLGIVKTIEESHPQIARIYKGIIGNENVKEETTQPNPNAKFLSYKFCLNMDQLMDELHNSSCHFIRCVKPNESKKPDTWVGYLVLKQITYMGLLDSLKVRKYNYPVRFKHDDFYRRYQDIDTNKEGSIPFQKLESSNQNFRKLTENLLSCTGTPWSEKDLLIGKTRIFINEFFKYQLDEILKIKQKAKREGLSTIIQFYKNQMKRKQVVSYIKGISRSIQLARSTLSSINAKVQYYRFKKGMQYIRHFQYNFRITMQHRNMALQYSKAHFIAKVCKLKLIQMQILKALKIKRAIDFVKARLKTKIYRNRQKFCKKVVNDLLNGVWTNIKSRYAEKSATDIQRYFRSHVKRIKQAKSIKILEDKVNNQVIFRSVTLIQSHIKGFLVRLRFRRLQMAARTIQGYFRSRWLRNYYIKLRRATLKIQKNFRKFYYKNNIIKSKLQEFVDNSHNMRQFGLKEYENLLGTLPYEIKTSDIVDYEFQKWTKKIISPDPSFQKFIPNPPEVELTPKAKLFAIPFDLSLTSETLEIYSGTWSGEMKSFMKKINDKGERLLHIIPGDSFTFCLTDDLRVYSFGANDQGQLCIDETKKMFSGRAREVLNLSKNPALQMNLGKDNGAMVSQSGRVFFWGKYSENQLGLKNRRKIDVLYVQNAIKEEVVSVSVRGAPGAKGEELTYVVGKSGQVYIFGEINDEDYVDNGFKMNGQYKDNTQRYSEAERNLKFKEIQRQHHQSIASNMSELNQNDKNMNSKISYRILDIEDDIFKETSKFIRKSSPIKDNPKLRSSNSNVKLVKEIDPYKKIIHISSGSDFSILLSDKGILFGLGENRFGELGVGDEVPRNSPTPINILRCANEKIEDVSCGFKHVLCRTNMGKIYSWGLGSYHQNGSLRSKNINVPTEVQFQDSQISSIARIRNVAASAFGSYFFFEDGSLYMLGKCGPGIFSIPNRFPYNTRMFVGKMKEEFVPVKVFANWSNMMSVGYLLFLDFRDVETAKNYKEKIAGLVSTKWRPGNILPSFDDNLYKYIQSKNLLKEKTPPLFIDVRYAGTSDGRPRSVRNINHGDDYSDKYSINENGNQYHGHPSDPRQFAKDLKGVNSKSNNMIGLNGNQSSNNNVKFLDNSDKQSKETSDLNRRYEELNNLNKTNIQKLKVGKPPIIAPPLKGYKEEPLKATIIKVDDHNRVVNSQSIVVPQRVYHKANKVSSKSPENYKHADQPVSFRDNWYKQNNNNVKEEKNKVAPIDRSRSKSKSHPNLLTPTKPETLYDLIQNNRESLNKSKPSMTQLQSNVMKESRVQNKSPIQRQSSIIKHEKTKYKRETLFDTPLDSNNDIHSNLNEDFSRVLVAQKNKPGSAFLRQSKFVNNKSPNKDAQEPFTIINEEPKPQPSGLNPALKRSQNTPSRPNHTPSNINKTNASFTKNKDSFSKTIAKNEIPDYKSKEGLFSQVSSHQNISVTQDQRQKKSEVGKSKISIKETDNKLKGDLHESIYKEVEKIMRKSPSKWNNIEKEIINSYVKLTKNLSR